MSEPLDPRRCSFTFVCERKWEELTPLPGQERVRHCDGCNTSVHWIVTESERMRALELKQCVMVKMEMQAGHWSGLDLIVGSFAPPEGLGREPSDAVEDGNLDSDKA